MITDCKLSQTITVNKNTSLDLMLDELYGYKEIIIFMEPYSFLILKQDYKKNCTGEFLLTVIMESNAQLEHSLMVDTVYNIKGEYRFILKESGAVVNSCARIIAKEAAKCCITTLQQHEGRKTDSSIDFKSVVLDQSTYSYRGTIFIAENIQDVKAFQSDKVLLMGKKSSANSIPNLQILSDQVRCGHASALATVTQEELFCLATRGIESFAAKNLIIKGFLL